MIAETCMMMADKANKSCWLDFERSMGLDLFCKAFPLLVDYYDI